MSKHEKTQKGGIRVEVRDGNIDSAIRLLKRKSTQEGIFQELKQREFYIKPGDRKRMEKAKAQKRHAKRNSIDPFEIRPEKKFNQDGGTYSGRVNIC